MSMFLLLTVLCILILIGVRESRPAVNFPRAAAGEAIVAAIRLLAVNWNGDESDKKSDGK